MVNDPSEGWDGTFKNELMNNGVYVYYAIIKLVDGSTHMYSGDVALMK